MWLLIDTNRSNKKLLRYKFFTYSTRCYEVLRRQINNRANPSTQNQMKVNHLLTYI